MLPIRSRRRPGGGTDRRRARLSVVALGLLAAGCGGGGGGVMGPGSAGAPAATAPSAYANSVALGSWSTQSIGYVAASATTAAEVDAATASALLRMGATALVAEHVEATLPGMREVCVSGDGQSTNVVSPINLGVISQNAAVLLDGGWAPVADQAGAWAVLAQRGAALTGWENCGVKPEGPASASSLLTIHADGGYAEDVYDGNPSTTFNIISQVVPTQQMQAMLGGGGFATTADPTRPMQLYWRIFSDPAGHQLLIEMGLPRATAPAVLKGFIALYVPST